MKEVSCCYNCKHCTLLCLCREDGSSNVIYKCEPTGEFVKLNNACDKWEKKE